MKLIPYDEKKVPNYWRPCKNQEIITKFLDSDVKCSKLEGWKHKTAYSCQRAMTMNLRRMRVENVIITVRKGEVFMIRTN